MKKICPVCKCEFDCYSNEIKKCHCSKVALNHKAKEFLAKHYDECLCSKCLEEVAVRFNINKYNI